MGNLSNQKCIPCEGDTKPLTYSQYSKYLGMINNWDVLDQVKIEKKFKFKNFKEAIRFVNEVSDIAEREQHHPDIYLHSYNKVRITLSTHAIKGLSINDFILASKIDLIKF